jgi:4'-phosphopantetheinyl transferase
MPAWILPSADLALTATDLHVWRASLDATVARVRHLRDTLSVDERTRADRFHFDRDRRRFIIARAALRSIIGRYLNLEPDDLVFDYGVRGKPALSPSMNSAQLHFNLAHSHELAVYAFTRHQRVGIDVEYTLRVVSDTDQLVKRFFSANEQAVYCALPAGEQRMAFFRCWTRKEAFIKAIGDGLSQPLDRFDVALAPEQSPGILSIDGSTLAAQHWSLVPLEPSADYIGAVAVEGQNWQISNWTWENSPPVVF